MSAKQGFSQEANGLNSRTLRYAEGTAEWPATGPENQSVVMSDGRSIRLPSAKFAQVREPGRNGPQSRAVAGTRGAEVIRELLRSRLPTAVLGSY